MKGPDGSEAVVKQELCYDSIVSVCGIYALWLFGIKNPKTVYNNNVYTIIFACHSASDTFQLFTIHQTLFVESPKYYMTQVRSFAIIDTIEVFWQKANTLRNTTD